MSLLIEQLESCKGRRIAVVMVDGARLKGRLTHFDDRTIILEDIQELVDNKWMRPLISRSVGSDLNITTRSADSDTPQRDPKDEAVLVKVILRIRHISRIWPWDLKAKPPGEDTESVNQM